MGDAAKAVGLSRSAFIREASLAAARLPTLFARDSANNVASRPSAPLLHRGAEGQSKAEGGCSHRKPKS